AISERYLHAGVEAARPRRAERARVGKGRTAIGEIRDGIGLEESPVGRIAIVEDVVDARVNLECLVDLIGPMQVEDGVRRQLRKLIGFVADKILAADPHRIAPQLELFGYPVVDAGFETIAG